ASDTKALTGHGDVVLGHVAVRDPERAQRLRNWRTQFGAVPGPMDVWLAHRSLGTLDVRLERMTANALAVARFLAGRPEVRRVRYPGLPDDPAHAVAARQMSRFGPVVSFELASAGAAEAFLARCRLVLQATSFGGLHTTAERRARWGGDKVPGGFVRLSAGCEHPEDLVSDIAEALAHADGRTIGDHREGSWEHEYHTGPTLDAAWAWHCPPLNAIGPGAVHCPRSTLDHPERAAARIHSLRIRGNVNTHHPAQGAARLGVRRPSAPQGCRYRPLGVP